MLNFLVFFPTNLNTSIPLVWKLELCATFLAALKRAHWLIEVVWSQTRYLVLGYEAIVVEESLDPARHAGSKPLKIAGIHLTKTDWLDFVDLVSPAGGELVGQLHLHDIPAVLNWIEMKGVARPVHGADVVVLEPVPDEVSSVTGGSILEEPVTAMMPHEPEEVLVQDIPVPDSVFLS